MSSSTDHVNDTDASCHGNMPSDKPTGWWFQPTPLKNMSQWEGWHPIYEMENNPNVPNHQPANICLRRLSIAATKLDSTVDWPIRKYIGASPTQPLVSFPQMGHSTADRHFVLLLNVTNLMAMMILGSYPTLQGFNLSKVPTHKLMPDSLMGKIWINP